MIDLCEEEKDVSLLVDIEKELNQLKEDIDKLNIETLLTEEFDKNNAILAIHAGAGGTEAQDWAEMLLRMFTRWAESKNYSVTILDILKDTEAGIKSATLLITGENAYGYLKSEKGVHRLVRISPFDAAESGILPSLLWM